MNNLDDLKFIDTVYRVFLGRDLNETEKGILKRHDAPVDWEMFRRSFVSSEEFLNVNRGDILPTLFPRPCIVAARTPMGQEIFVDMRQLHLGFAIANNAFEPSETRFIAGHVKAGQVTCDVGANIGYYTTIMAGLVGNAGRVFAFEPLQESYLKLQAAIQRNNLQNIVVAYDLALSGAEGKVMMKFDRNGINIGAARLAESDDEDGSAREPVITRRLDDVLSGQPVHFLKIDVEGAEMLVLDGAEKTLLSRPTMLIEFNEEQLRMVSHATSADLASRLISIGYQLHEIQTDGNTVLLGNVEADLPRLLGPTGIFNAAAIPSAA